MDQKTWAPQRHPEKKKWSKPVSGLGRLFPLCCYDTGRLRLKMQKIHRVNINLVRLNLLKSRKTIERHWIYPRRNLPARTKKIWRRLREPLSRGSASWWRFTRDSQPGRSIDSLMHVESFQPVFQVLSNCHKSIQRTRLNGFKLTRRRPLVAANVRRLTLITILSVSKPNGPWGERGEIIASLSHFPDFYTKQALKVWWSPLHAVFYWNVKGKTRKKRKNTASFVASLGAGVQPRSTVQLFMPVSGVEKRPFSQFFFSAFGCHLARKSLSRRVMAVSNKKQEFEQRKRIKLFDEFWVRAYRFDFAPRRRPRARSI